MAFACSLGAAAVAFLRPRSGRDLVVGSAALALTALGVRLAFRVTRRQFGRSIGLLCR